MKRLEAPQPKIKYPVQEEPMTFSKALMDLLLKDDQYSNIVALYLFYYYTAKWQGTNKPKATTEYVANGVHWGVDKVRTIKSKLKRYGLIEDIIQRDEYGRVQSHYIKLNFTFTTLGNHPGLVKSEVNTLKPNIRKILSEKNIIPPPLKLVEDYCSQRKNKINPQAFIDFYDSKGWLIGKNRMKDWQAAIRTWEQNDKKQNNKNLPKFIIDDGRRFDLCDDGHYRNVHGEVYIP